MKNFLLLSAALLLVFLANAQIVNIPDANFKAALVGNSSINTNMDTEIQVSEAVAYADTIFVQVESISDLTGIEAFTSIKGLCCAANQLTSLDVSNNTALTDLDCRYNQLTFLDVSNNTSLVNLSCSSNQLTILNVSNNLLLNSLNCSYNSLTSLDVSNNTVLIYLDCRSNLLDTIDISNNTDLVELNCSYNLMGTLDLSNNSFLSVLNCYSGQLTSLNVSNNPNLSILSCSVNLLTNLDLSNNLALKELNCSHNQLTALDLSNNSSLLFLYCHDNLLNDIELSNSVDLLELYCFGNVLSTLDVSNNTALEMLFCDFNQLTSLDVSNNIELFLLNCSSNQLNMLNAKNGNNYNFATSSDFLAYNNPNLFCIEVDDPIWSEANWPNVDSNASYSSNCLYGITYPKTITGKVVADDNCVMNGSEQGINNIIVKTDDNNYYGLTEISGSYTIITDTGTYIIVQVLNNPLITPLCPIPNYYTIYFDTLGMDTTNIDFYNEAIACQYLTIDINSDRRRRCFTNNTLIHYCNDGFADAVNTQVHVHFPDFMSIVSADYPYTTDSLGNYVFDIGTLAQGDCGDIHIIDSVACIPGITGLTQCTEVWITPPNDCANSLDTASYNAWDHSSVMVEGECISDSIVRFIITNTGDVGGGDMQIPSEYRIYADNLLVYTGTFQLNGQEELVIDIPADGRTYRLEADQHPNHHGNSHPNETIEACGDGSTPISNGFVNSMPMDDTDPEIEIDCMMILDSYDPNDKSVSPQGITDNNYLLQGTMLDYVIRFQNTGSDTAYTVVVVDTLSSNLDISTFQQGISSHPYTFDVRGQGSPVLFFQFFNINLPDSTTDEENSHGFVKFKIAPYDSLSNGTIIENTAYIYFDYNIPVITNIALVTISDTAIIGNPISIIGIEDNSGYQNMDFKAIPNPFSDQIEFIFKNTSTYEIRIFNILGKEAYSAKVTGNNCSVSTSELPGGTYLIKVKSEERVGIKKMVKH